MTAINLEIFHGVMMSYFGLFDERDVPISPENVLIECVWSSFPEEPIELSIWQWCRILSHGSKQKIDTFVKMVTIILFVESVCSYQMQSLGFIMPIGTPFKFRLWKIYQSIDMMRDFFFLYDR